MLSYQHGFHAGNYADVIKHLVLTRLLSYMTIKAKPLLYLDTHAGKGCYDLNAAQALKTAEAQQGIARLWREKNTLSPLFQPYIACLNSLNPNGNLRFYPGSPYLAAHLLRNHDRMVICEKHPQEFSALCTMSQGRPNLACLETDGLHTLKAHTPPKEKRGLIFVDPSYEIKTEYRQIPLALAQAWHRFATGTFCLWYPIVDPYHHRQILRNLAVADQDGLRLEFYLTRQPQPGLWGCGLWIVNPPYILKQELQHMLPLLCKLLNAGEAWFLLTENLTTPGETK